MNLGGGGGGRVVHHPAGNQTRRLAEVWPCFMARRIVQLTEAHSWGRRHAVSLSHDP